jgi:(4-(4-[2-(gamma-L-glutamylamino)ethyl]phenoxymethyl)furan-2-yl)methanamine synthase
MTSVVGWDIGGAHLKAARAENDRIVEAVQVASPLRLGIEAIDRAFAQAKAKMSDADRHVCTMTGELADTFASRADGVVQLAAAAVRALEPERIMLYAGRAGFIAPQAAAHHVEDIASANWHATASLVARLRGSALLIDMGSTTTDVVPVVDGAVAARGYTDAERLACGELVYTGLVRSFVMALAERAPVAGGWTQLVHENFANIADVHRLLKNLPEGADQMQTADGRPKTPDASRARLARMVGRDANDGTDWTALARWFAEAQIRTITDAALLVLSRGELPAEAPVVAAGIGTAVVAEVARRIGRTSIGFETLLDATPQARIPASHCAPAAALALLASGIDVTI